MPIPGVLSKPAPLGGQTRASRRIAVSAEMSVVHLGAQMGPDRNENAVADCNALCGGTAQDASESCRSCPAIQAQPVVVNCVERFPPQPSHIGTPLAVCSLVGGFRTALEGQRTGLKPEPSVLLRRIGRRAPKGEGYHEASRT